MRGPALLDVAKYPTLSFTSTQVEKLDSRTARVGGNLTAMARIFVLERPPNTPLLATYGDDFAAFIATFEPARELAYLADVARLEAARTRAYHAMDATPLGAAEFAAVDTFAVDGLRVDLHPSAEIVRSPHPIVTIWAMNSGERELVPIENWHGEDALKACADNLQKQT